MKASILLFLAAVSSLLIANELRYSAMDVLSGMYEEVPGVFQYDQYTMLHTAFVVIGVLSIVFAIGLLILDKVRDRVS